MDYNFFQEYPKMPVNSFENYYMSWKPRRENLHKPYYLCLAEQLEHDIAQGYLPAGTKLPPQRELADFLDLNFTTITRVYKECELRGLIQAVTGKGTFVCAYTGNKDALSTSALPSQAYDFGYIASYEQFGDIAASAVRQLAESRHLPELLDYKNPTGLPQHRYVAASWLNDAGVPCSEDTVIITAGAQNALTVCLLALFSPGDRIAVDRYTHSGFIQLAKMHRLQLVAIDGDAEGMSAVQLEQVCRTNTIRGIYLVPSCGNPTTVMMSEDRKMQIAKIINQYSLTLLEDDNHVFITAHTVPGFSGSVSRFVSVPYVYVASMSKSFCSGLRIAFMAVSPLIYRAVEKAVFVCNIKTSSLDAQVLCSILSDGTGRKILEMKKDFAVRDGRLFAEIFPEAAAPGNPYCSFRWLAIKRTEGGGTFEDFLMANGIRAYHSYRFLAASSDEDEYLRISLSNEPNPVRLREGLLKLRQFV